MAKIVHSEAAPAETVHYTFGNVEFDLGGRTKSYETDDAQAIANAEAHPWLEVKRDPVPVDEPAEPVEDVQRVAIDAGKTQTEPVVKGDVAETLAADETTKTAQKNKDS